MGFQSDKPVVLKWLQAEDDPCKFTLIQNRVFQEGWQLFTDTIQGLETMPEVASSTRHGADAKAHIIRFVSPPSLRIIKHIEGYVIAATSGTRTAFEFNRDGLKLDAVDKGPPLKGEMESIDARVAKGDITYRQAYTELRAAALRSLKGK